MSRYDDAYTIFWVAHVAILRCLGHDRSALLPVEMDTLLSHAPS